MAREHSSLALSTRWWSASAVFLLGAISLTTLALTRNSPSLPAPISTGVVPTGSPKPFGVPLARSIPVQLRIPALRLSVPLIELGLNRDGTVQVPATTSQVGWYRYGVTPGQIGSAVLLGHVDSYRGPGVFFLLRTLVPGNRIIVTLADGRRANFDVTAVRIFSKSSFPAQKVYGSRGYSGLQLVTCGGRFNSVTGSYESNVVVFSRLV